MGPISSVRAARLLCLLVGLAAAVGLLGSVLGIAPLAALWPDQPPVKANTALGLLLAAATLLVAGAGPASGRARGRAVRIGALVVAALGLLTLAEHVFDLDLGLDQLLASDPEGVVEGAAPGRMGPICAIDFMLVGAALLLLDARTRSGRCFSPWLSAGAALLALLALIGHLHGTSFFHGLSRHAAMRLPVSILFLLLWLALILARPQTGPVLLLGSQSAGGTIARRLLAVAFATPVLVGLLATTGERAGKYDAHFASALIVAASVLTLVGSIAASAWKIHRLDEQRVQTRARELAARQALEERDRFLMVAAHELYSPISSLQLMVQALELGLADEPGRCLASVGRQTRRLTAIVQDLLDVSRVKRGEIHLRLETVNLVEVANRVVERFSLPLARARCTLALHLRAAPASLTGWWDRLRLEQVLGKLMSNAVKFGAGKPIDLSLDSDGSQARITIADQGVGIPADRVGSIFERFERAVSEQNYGGLGVGLYVVRGIVQSLGGTVEAESTMGLGAKFTVTLPCAGPPAPPGQPVEPGREIRA